MQVNYTENYAQDGQLIDWEGNIHARKDIKNADVYARKEVNKDEYFYVLQDGMHNLVHPGNESFFGPVTKEIAMSTRLVAVNEQCFNSYLLFLQNRDEITLVVANRRK